MENPDKYHKHIRCSLISQTPFADPECTILYVLVSEIFPLTPPFPFTKAFMFLRLHNAFLASPLPSRNLNPIPISLSTI